MHTYSPYNDEPMPTKSNHMMIMKPLTLCLSFTSSYKHIIQLVQGIHKSELHRHISCGQNSACTKLTSADPDSTWPRGTCTVENLCPCFAEWSRPVLASLTGSSRWQARIMHRLSPLEIANQKNAVNVTTA